MPPDRSLLADTLGPSGLNCRHGEKLARFWRDGFRGDSGSHFVLALVRADL